MAVWLRSSLIGVAAILGALSDWQHGTELDDVVFRVAANIPLAGGGINPEAFVQRLQEETAG